LNDTPLLAAFDGQIVRTGWDQYGYGNYVEIWSPAQQCAVIYAHLRGFTVTIGQQVKQGQLIGYSDNTGNSSGPHLHFAICATDANGVKLNKTNGYAGWLDVLDHTLVSWSASGSAPHP